MFFAPCVRQQCARRRSPRSRKGCGSRRRAATRWRRRSCGPRDRGPSAGGMVALFTAGVRQPEGLVAVLAFAAGRGGNPALHPGVPCAAEPLARVLDMVGRSIKAPAMFHYAENDQYFNPDTTRFWFQRFSAGGARAEYVLQPPFGDDGHYVFGDRAGIRYWVPAVESFLARYGVPFKRLDTSASLSR